MALTSGKRTQWDITTKLPVIQEPPRWVGKKTCAGRLMSTSALLACSYEFHNLSSGPSVHLDPGKGSSGAVVWSRTTKRLGTPRHHGPLSMLGRCGTSCARLSCPWAWFSQSYSLGAPMISHRLGSQVVTLVLTLQAWLCQARPWEALISPPSAVSLRATIGKQHGLAQPGRT